MIIVANKIKIIKNKDSKSLSSYYIDMINKETNYWFNVSIIKNLRDENFILSTTIKKYESYNTFKFNKYLNDILNRNK